MTENLTNGNATYPIWNTSPNIYCHPAELSFLHCTVILCDCIMKRDSQVQGGCYRKWIGGTLQICKILKPGGTFSSWGEISYQHQHCPGAQWVVI